MIHAQSQSPRLKLAISACLLGNEVRYNGGHKQSLLCREVLGKHFDFQPLCPEMAIGLGAPREPIRLVGDPGAPRAVGTVTRERDVTEALAGYAEGVAARLHDVSGLIVMQKSPSCGMERVKVYQDDGRPAEQGAGIFTATLARLRPELPIEEDGRLHDPVLRENFIARVFAYGDWQRLCAEGLTRKGIIAFHSRHKYLLMAHHPLKYRELGRLLAGIGAHDPAEFGPRYFAELMAALKRCATRGTHANVLQHLSGYLRRALPGEERREIQQLIEQYREGMVPLVVPLTLLKHHFRRHPDRYVALQAYLQPHPQELGLRNAI
ncbi:conserved hypothetical protein [Pseudomonas sp. OF001]|jgi:uncharacterized protein YbgA (DUF1722 family)/uncharacterized protein YbbK (DUF523 family)|uniref:YbgA family protein n=1 Tax=unclassified Pseudomonas TaxID=196821 RepID=UPI0010A6A087|nr:MULTISPECIES: 2-thiouracil desulfurase family protein [unclassified Pseudomonas]THG78777.1 DUF1722 domain-containing protein [Pseudomonas sp. A-1]WPP44019.1 2-thiouracil desulfurase family protein [Pseudomonas sp. AN-1]CAD5379751.1 conserved hypothetical protein [Pseudomonas sp. OF001]